MISSVVVIAGPSAIGKTYLVENLLADQKASFESAQVYTTRNKRPGESGIDRKFISEDQFNSMVNSGEFIVHGTFAGNKYGYTKESLTPKNKHIVVNAWPEIVDQFIAIKNTKIIGLVPSDEFLQVIIKRLEDRKEAPEITSLRIEIVHKDIQDLEQKRDLITTNGKYFIIENNDTMNSVVAPFIKKLLAI